VNPSTLRPESGTGRDDFDAFYATERRRLFSTLVRVTGDRQVADDLTQEAFVRVLERWDRVGHMDSAVGYLYRVALNLHRSRVRSALGGRAGFSPSIPSLTSPTTTLRPG